MHNRNTSGFTLIELSIVLVIIGLIVGGVLVGRDMIKAAALRQLGSQIESYNTAVQVFISKYNCLPGDCANGTEFFGTSSDGCPIASYNTHKSGTCNGDGNGLLDVTLATNAPDEGLRLWEMLAQAGLVAAGYHTAGPPAWASGTAGSIWPALPSALTHNLINTGIRAYWHTTPLFVPPMSGGHIFIVGRHDQAQGNSKAALSPREAKSYDVKFDDGLPKSGNVKGAMYNTGNYIDIYSACFTGTDYLSYDDYDFTDSTSGHGCALFIQASF